MAAQRNSTVGDAVQSESRTVIQESVPSVESVTIDGVLEITVSTSVKVNVGNYESKDTFGSVKGRFKEGTSADDVSVFLFNRLYATLSEELDYLKGLAIDNSFIHNL